MMEMGLDMGGFCGTYIASFGKLGNHGLVDVWITMGVGNPPALAAAAAKKRLKEK